MYLVFTKMIETTLFAHSQTHNKNQSLYFCTDLELNHWSLVNYFYRNGQESKLFASLAFFLCFDLKVEMLTQIYFLIKTFFSKGVRLQKVSISFYLVKVNPVQKVDIVFQRKTFSKWNLVGTLAHALLPKSFKMF